MIENVCWCTTVSASGKHRALEFTDATTEAQREQLSSLRSPSEIVMLIELEPSPGLSLVHHTARFPK